MMSIFFSCITRPSRQSCRHDHDNRSLPQMRQSKHRRQWAKSVGQSAISVQRLSGQRGVDPENALFPGTPGRDRTGLSGTTEYAGHQPNFRRIPADAGGLDKKNSPPCRRYARHSSPRNPTTGWNSMKSGRLSGNAPGNGGSGWRCAAGPAKSSPS